MLLLRNGELEMKIDNVIVMWIVIEKWLIGSECDELIDFVYCCWEVMKMVYDE